MQAITLEKSLSRPMTVLDDLGKGAIVVFPFVKSRHCHTVTSTSPHQITAERSYSYPGCISIGHAAPTPTPTPAVATAAAVYKDLLISYVSVLCIPAFALPLINARRFVRHTSHPLSALN